MSEVDRLETAIGFVRKGELHRAAELLDQSHGAMTRENGRNCRRLAAAPDSFLGQMLLQCLDQELAFARTFGF